jgi:DNA-binding NarL/FixJ family response regulator
LLKDGELVLSKSGVRVHIAALVKKLAVEDRAAAAAIFRNRSEN